MGGMLVGSHSWHWSAVIRLTRRPFSTKFRVVMSDRLHFVLAGWPCCPVGWPFCPVGWPFPGVFVLSCVPCAPSGGWVLSPLGGGVLPAFPPSGASVGDFGLPPPVGAPLPLPDGGTVPPLLGEGPVPPLLGGDAVPPDVGVFGAVGRAPGVPGLVWGVELVGVFGTDGVGAPRSPLLGSGSASARALGAGAAATRRRQSRTKARAVRDRLQELNMVGTRDPVKSFGSSPRARGRN